MDRHDRQIRVNQIGPVGQQKLANSTLLVVGAGALGSYAAEQLTRAGIGTLLLVDPDWVSLTNLQRQTLYTQADVTANQFKVTAAKAHLLAIDSTVNIQTYPTVLSEELLLTLPHFDLALDCTDNFQVRGLLNELALKYQFDYIFAACAGVSGQVMAISPQASPCLACVYPDLDQLAQTDCDVIGVNTALVPLVSSLQVSLVFKYLIDYAQVDFTQLYSVDNWQLTFDHFTIKKAPTCPICHQSTTKITHTYQNQVRQLCGTDTYSIYFDQQPALTDFRHFLNNQKLTFSDRKIALTFQWQNAQVSYFKNGRLMLYDLPNITSATNCYQSLLSRFQQEKERYNGTFQYSNHQ